MTHRTPAVCTGDCDQGRRDCTCAGAVVGMWDDEAASPWTYALLYTAAILVGLVGAHAFARWG